MKLYQRIETLCAAHSITVTELCRACGVSRKTFYYHFQDKYAILELLQETYARELGDLINSFTTSDTFFDLEQIDRINTLYHKSQSVGLTEEEKAEQAALRREYIESIRNSLRGHLNSISIVEKDGTITDLGKKYGHIGDKEH